MSSPVAELEGSGAAGAGTEATRAAEAGEQGGPIDVPLVDALMAMLFAADSPAALATLAQAAQVTEGQAEQALDLLSERLERSGPLQLVRIAGGYQLCTKRIYAETIARFLKPQGHRLSRSLMEVLAIVAYRQPITVAEIDEVRGVQSDYSLRALVERRLVHEVGRKQVAGRPILYGTTKQFLHQFKMEDLTQLPPLNTEAPALESGITDSSLSQE